MAGVNPTVRPCRLDEAEALLELWRASGATPSATDTVEGVTRAIQTVTAAVLVAEAEGRLVGSIIGGFDGWRGNIYRLVVHPESRRRGIARALVAELERRLSDLGARRVTALVESASGRATGFWEAAGYEHDPRIRRYRRDL